MGVGSGKRFRRGEAGWCDGEGSVAGSVRVCLYAQVVFAERDEREKDVARRANEHVRENCGGPEQKRVHTYLRERSTRDARCVTAFPGFSLLFSGTTAVTCAPLSPANGTI